MLFPSNAYPGMIFCLLVLSSIVAIVAVNLFLACYYEDEIRIRDPDDLNTDPSIMDRLKRRPKYLIALAVCCVVFIGLVCSLFGCISTMEERKASVKKGVQAAFAEAGYQVSVDDVVPLYGSCYGIVTTINKPVLSSDGSEIAPKGSLAYYISEDGRTVRIYKDGAEIAAVNGEE